MNCDFTKKVYSALRALPPGTVTTYGQLARIAGSPGAARAVGNILHNNPDPIYTPCFRVVNSAGKLTKNFAFGGIKQQRKMLMDDGIVVASNKVDLAKYKISDEEWMRLIAAA